MKDIKNCCCFTGHRIISAENILQISEKLPTIIADLAKDGVTDFISGGALGFDTLAALAVLGERDNNTGIRLILALPCKEQAKYWNKKQVAQYKELLTLADEIIYVSEEYTPECMKKRNEFMVDNSSCCVFFMTHPRGGTASTIKYAIEKEKKLINVMI